MPVFTSDDKRMSLTTAAAIVQDGMTLAIGGGLSWREPIALLRELVRRVSDHAAKNQQSPAVSSICGPTSAGNHTMAAGI